MPIPTPTPANTFALPSAVTATIPPMPNAPAGTASTTAQVTQLTLRQATDDPVLKKVYVSFYEGRFPLTVWEGDTYDAAGNWTQEQLNIAIATLIAANPTAVVNSLFTVPIPTHDQRIAESARIRAVFPHGIPRAAWLPPAPPVVQPQHVPAP